MFKVFLCLFFLGSTQLNCSSGDNGTNKSLPVVMWHGMGKIIFSVKYSSCWYTSIERKIQIFAGDTCCFSFSLGSFRDFLINVLGSNTYVKSIRIGKNIIEDYDSGYFVHPNKQVEDACRQIASDSNLQNGYNAIGFSQGSQFL